MKSIIDNRNGGNIDRDRSRLDRDRDDGRDRDRDRDKDRDRDRDRDRAYTHSGWETPTQSAWEGKRNLDLDSAGRVGSMDLRRSLSGPSQLLRGNIFDDDVSKMDQTLVSDRFGLSTLPLPTLALPCLFDCLVLIIFA